MKMKLIKVITIAATLLATTAFANPPGSGENNGNGCLENCGHQGGSNGGGGGNGGSEGNGGSGGSGGSGYGTGTGVGVASAAAVSSASGGASSANALSGSNANEIKSYSLSGGSVGSPSN